MNPISLTEIVITPVNRCATCNRKTEAQPLTHLDRKIVLCSVECMRLYQFGMKKPKQLKKYENKGKL